MCPREGDATFEALVELKMEATHFLDARLSRQLADEVVDIANNSSYWQSSEFSKTFSGCSCHRHHSVCGDSQTLTFCCE